MISLLLAAVIAASPMQTEASWYGEAHNGQLMANGHPFDPHAYTCASWDYPLGTVLRVTDLVTGLPVYVEVTDRGPARRLYDAGRRIDLSMAAFMVIRDARVGLAQVSIEPAPSFQTAQH